MPEIRVSDSDVILDRAPEDRLRVAFSSGSLKKV
jgi:hypothetical protein